MITMRPAPKRSATAGASCRIHITLKTTCSTPACSQPAVSTVHQRPNWNTGTAPLAPIRNRTSVLGDSIAWMRAPESSSEMT